MSNSTKYTYRVIWSDRDDCHVGLCDEFPSLSYLAETEIAALEGIHKLVADALDDMEKSNEPPPEPLP